MLQAQGPFAKCFPRSHRDVSPEQSSKLATYMDWVSNLAALRVLAIFQSVSPPGIHQFTATTGSWLCVKRHRLLPEKRRPPPSLLPQAEEPRAGSARGSRSRPLHLPTGLLHGLPTADHIASRSIPFDAHDQTRSI